MSCLDAFVYFSVSLNASSLFCVHSFPCFAFSLRVSVGVFFWRFVFFSVSFAV